MIEQKNNLIIRSNELDGDGIGGAVLRNFNRKCIQTTCKSH